MQTYSASEIATNIAAVRAEIKAACQRAGRPVQAVTLVAITKLRSVSEIVAALQSGVTHLGENRVEEGLEKIRTQPDWLPDGVPPPAWHMVGHVQSRKAQAVVQAFDWIHSLDSHKLARRYHQFLDSSPRRPQVLLEMNTSGEAAKYGYAADRWEDSATQRQTLWEQVERLGVYANVQMVGLMTMAPFTDDERVLRITFARLRRLRDALREDFPTHEWRELSMGMTNDYPIAVEEGATLVRVGRAIFGERPQP